MTACRTCGSDPCVNPSFCRLSRHADAKLAAERRAGRPRESAEILRARHLLAQDVSLEQTLAGISDSRGSVAASTVEALAYQLRAGASALRESKAQRRLAQLDESQMREICGRLTKERWGISKNGEMPPRVPPWKLADIEQLVQLWSNLHG
jgi:hypothetical protein